MQQALVNSSNKNISYSVLGRHKQPQSHKCSSCKLDVAQIYLCDHVIDNNISNYKLCSRELCRCCAVRWHGGADYCKAHLPSQKLGNIIVGSVREYDLTDGYYIGRQVVTGRESYQASILANPYKITDFPDLKTNMDKYKKDVLWDGIKKKNNIYFKLCQLRDYVLRGETLVLLCWCKEKGKENNPCHGDVIKSCIENYMIPQFLS